MKLTFNETPQEDLIAVLAYLEGISNGSNTNVNVVKLRTILSEIRQDFPHVDGLEQASIFKKAANLLVYFISERPVDAESFEALTFSKEIRSIPNHVNTVIAILLAFELVHEAEIYSKDGSKNHVLTNKIKLSKHSFADIVEALSNATPSTHFKMATVLLEQLAYKTNPECQYELLEWF